MDNLVYININLDQILNFYAGKVLKGRLIETIVDTSKNRVIFELFIDKEDKEEGRR